MDQDCCALKAAIFAVHKLLLKSIRRAVVWSSVCLLFSEEKLVFFCVYLAAVTSSGEARGTQRIGGQDDGETVKWGQWAREIKGATGRLDIKMQQWWSLLRQSVYGCCLFFWWWRICILCFSLRIGNNACSACEPINRFTREKKPPCLPSRLPFL